MGVRLSQNAFVGGILSPALHARADLDKYGFCVKRAKNVFVHRWGGISNRAGTIFVGEVKDSTKPHRLFDFSFSTTQAYALDFGNLKMRVIKDRGYVLESTKAITGITQASPGVITAVGHGYSIGDQVRPASIVGMTQLNAKNYLVNTVPSVDTLTLKSMYGVAVNTSAFTAYTSGGTLARVYSLTTPWADTEVFDIGFAQSPDILYSCHLSYAVRKITRSGHASWTIASVVFGPVILAPTSPGAVASPSSGVTVHNYKVTSINDATGEESLPTALFSATNDLTIAGNVNTLSWTVASNATRYIIYKEDNGVYGFIGGVEANSFVDDNIVPDLGDTPPGARNPFNAAGDYPRRCTFHEQRLALAATANDPSLIILSQTAKYENLNVSTPAKADDAITMRLSPGVAAITGLVSMKDGLITFTNEREFLITGSGVTDYLTPASNFSRKQTKRGSADRPPPLEIGDLTLYVQRQGAVIRAFGYVFQTDKYKGNDLTLLAPHLFKGRTVVDWSYAQDPHSIVWVVLDNGNLLSLTFEDDQNVFAWAEHNLGGAYSTGNPIVESCCVVEGADEDEVHLVVKRTINGQTKKYIEIISPRWIASYDDEDDPNSCNNIEDAYFVDCGQSYDGSPATSFAGLDHLEGQAVVALADGNYVSGLTVSGGAVTLPNAASVVHVGLAYSSEIATLPVSQQTQAGAPQGKFKRVVDTVLKVELTRGIKAGPDVDHLTDDIILRKAENWNDPMLPYTGDVGPITFDGKWDKDGAIVIMQTYPLPMTILGNYPMIDTGS